MSSRTTLVSFCGFGPRLLGLGFLLVFLFLSETAEAGLKLDLERVTEPVLREAIENSFNFPSTGLVKPEGLHDQETEAVRLTRLMHAFGYIEARTEVLKGTDGQSVLRPEPGNIYSLGYVALNGLSRGIAEPLQTKLQFVADRYMGQAARADTIAVIRRDVLRMTEESRYPAPVIRSMVIRKDSPTLLAGLDISMETGPQARFGDVILRGGGEVDGGGIAKDLSGTSYDPAAVDRLRRQMEDLGKFRYISLSLVAREGNPAIVDIVADLRRKNKTEEDLADNGLGLAVFVACGAMVILRQIVVSTSMIATRNPYPVIDIALVSALLVGAVLAFERIVYFIN